VKPQDILVNDVVQDTYTGEKIRILWIDRILNYCYVIIINGENPLPFRYKVEELVEQLYTKNFIYAEDNLISQRLSVKEINDKDRLIRDNAWESIKTLVKLEPEIYERNKRGKLIKEIESKGISSKKTVLKNLRKYWQRGMVINCLLPDYVNCGNKGNYEYKVKTGRPRIRGGGVNITTEIKEIFKKSIKKYYLNEKKPSLSFAYKMMLKENYNKGYYYDENGKHLKLEEEVNIPSYAQYYYWFKKLFTNEIIIKKRKGESAYERNHRQMLGATEFDSLGPGSLYQIDSTPADIFLLNRLNTNWMVGKPTLYFVIDVFSRIITGFYICLNAASWISMATALKNSFNDKQEYCKSLGIQISEEYWPVKGLPSAIIGDRGELESKFADGLVNGLGVEIQNNPPYRPDWKGIVEQLFHSSHENIRGLLPGYLHKDSGGRGTKDFRPEATLTLDDYIKVIVFFINFYNHNHNMKDYIRSKEMINDNVRPLPIELWNWGIKNHGALRNFESKLVDFHLLPIDNATVTPEGIRYKTMLYTCETAIKENWFSKARKKKWKIKFSYDPRNMDLIYLHSSGNSTFIPCNLLEHQEKYKSKSIDEIDQLIDYEKNSNDDFKHEKLENQLNLFLKIEEVVADAKFRKVNHQNMSITKSEKFKKVKETRTAEAEQRSLEDSFKLVDEVETNNEDIQSEDTPRKDSFSIIDLFEKQREKKTNGK
jgi:hypothetical protein